MKKISILIAALMSFFVANAETFYVDSIEYSLAYPADSVVAVSHCYQSGDVVIPETVSYYGRTYKVNRIGYGAFLGDTYGMIHSIALPNTIKYIESHNFNDYMELTNIVIPNSVKEININCFNRCSGLRSVDLHTTSVPGDCFNHCPDLEKVTIANTVTKIWYECFSYDSALTEIVIGDACTEISRDCFKCCPAVKKITIGSSLRSVGEYSFMSVIYSSGPNPQYAQVDTVVVHGSDPSNLPLCPFDVSNAQSCGINYHTTILIVPCNTRSIYEHDYGWNQFYNVVEDCSTNTIDNITWLGDDISIFSLDGRIIMHSEKFASGIICDMEGRIVETLSNGMPSTTLSNGVYIVCVGTLPARKVVVIR